MEAKLGHNIPFNDTPRTQVGLTEIVHVTTNTEKQNEHMNI